MKTIYWAQAPLDSFLNCTYNVNDFIRMHRCRHSKNQATNHAKQPTGFVSEWKHPVDGTPWTVEERKDDTASVSNQVHTLVKRSLSTNQSIRAIMSSGKRFSSRYLHFTWVTAEDNRHAISCAKRHLRRAVDRNYFKRINRVQASEKLTQDPPIHLLVGSKQAIAKVPREHLNHIVDRAWQAFLKQSSAS